MNLRTLILFGISLIILVFVGANMIHFLHKSLYGGDTNDTTIYINHPTKQINLKIGDSVVSNYSKIKLSIDEIYRTQKVKGNMGYRKIKDNETFIIVKVKVENLGNRSYYISNMDFNLVDEYGNKYDCEMNTLDIKNALTITTIPPHRYEEGYIIYKVPKNIKTVKITYDFRNIQNIFDSSKVVWEINMSDIPYIEEFPQDILN